MKRIIIISIVVLIVICSWLSISCRLNVNSNSVNNFLIAITFCIIWWYAYETYLLRKTTVEQKELQIQPLLVLDFLGSDNERRAYLKNIGNGIAMNIEIDDIAKKYPKYDLNIDYRLSKSLDKGQQIQLDVMCIIEEGGKHGYSIPHHAAIDPCFATEDQIFRISYKNIQQVSYETIVSTGKSGIIIKSWGKK